MVRQLGTPTWFLAADLKWPDMIRVIARQFSKFYKTTVAQSAVSRSHSCSHSYSCSLRPHLSHGGRGWQRELANFEAHFLVHFLFNLNTVQLLCLVTMSYLSVRNQLIKEYSLLGATSKEIQKLLESNSGKKLRYIANTRVNKT